MTDAQTPGTQIDPQAPPKAPRNRNPNGRRQQPSVRQVAIRQVPLDWLEEQAPDAPMPRVDELVRQMSEILSNGGTRQLRSSWRLKPGATPDDARRVAARLEASWPGGERR